MADEKLDLENLKVWIDSFNPETWYQRAIISIMAHYCILDPDLILEYKICNKLIETNEEIILESNKLNTLISDNHRPIFYQEDFYTLNKLIRTLVNTIQPNSPDCYYLQWIDQLDRRLDYEQPNLGLPLEAFTSRFPIGPDFKGKEKLKYILDILVISALSAAKLHEEEAVWAEDYSGIEFTIYSYQYSYFQFYYTTNELTKLEKIHLKALGHNLLPSGGGLSIERLELVDNLAKHLQTWNNLPNQEARLIELLHRYVSLDDLWYLLRSISEIPPYEKREDNFYSYIPHNFPPYLLFAINLKQYPKEGIFIPNQSLNSSSTNKINASNELLCTSSTLSSASGSINEASHFQSPNESKEEISYPHQVNTSALPEYLNGKSVNRSHSIFVTSKNEKYKDLSGDLLKRAILNEIKSSLSKVDNEEDLVERWEGFIASGDIDTLNMAQDYPTLFFKKETDSFNAAINIFNDFLSQIRNKNQSTIH